MSVTPGDRPPPILSPGTGWRRARAQREVPAAVGLFVVVLLVVQGFAINRLAGIDYPRWSPGRGAAQR